MPATPGGKKTFLLAINDMTRYIWLVLIDTKDKSFTTITRLQARAKAEVSYKPGTLCTDHWREFTVRAFGEY